MRPFEFVDAVYFQKRVDLSAAGVLQECGECHVGGGAMEYVPAPDLDNRVSLRDIASTDVNGFGPITAADYTAFNYFIDTYDVDGDGDKLEVLYMDYAQTGVMEMDCFICHLRGYDYVDRREMLRKAKFDASRAIGAGVATENTVDFGQPGYGTEVYYNSFVVDDGSGNLKFSPGFLANLKAQPPSDNCAFCHFNHGSVDWKKRGDNWKNDVTHDVHSVLGCMGCHERKAGTDVGTDGDAASPLLGQCDPAKGNAPYSSLWNASDNTVKTCENCHLEAGYDAGTGEYSNDYGAPNPLAAHQQYGFTAKIVQQDADGIVNRSHLEIMECSVCHVRKISGDSWNTGGAIVDATGPDAEGRLADHENEYVSRLMYDGATDTTNLVYTWQNGRIYAANVLTTIFWRDKNDAFDYNGDGQPGMMDALLMTDVLAADVANGWTSLSADGSGTIDASAIGARIAALNSHLDGVWGAGANVKLSSLAVPFKVNHNVAPASYALGHQCTDCHAAGKFFDRAYRLQGDAMDLTYDAGQVTPFTKLGGTTPTDFHPNTKDRAGASIPVRVLSGTAIADIQVADLLYQPTGSYVDSGGTSHDKAGWISYLTTAIGDGSGFGIGVPPTAAITTDLSSPFTVGDTVTLTAANSAAAGSSYFWNVQDQPGTLSGQTVAYTLNYPGTYQVLLTVIGPQGDLVQQVASIQVLRQAAATQVSYSATSGSDLVTFNLSNIPAHDELILRYGDGTWETLAHSGATGTVSRHYRLRDKYLQGTDYVYTATVQVKNGGSPVENVKFTVTIPQ